MNIKITLLDLWFLTTIFFIFGGISSIALGFWGVNTMVVIISTGFIVIHNLNKNGGKNGRK